MPVPLSLTKANGALAHQRAATPFTFARLVGRGLLLVGGMEPAVLTAAVHLVTFGCLGRLSKPRARLKAKCWTHE